MNIELMPLNLMLKAILNSISLLGFATKLAWNLYSVRVDMSKRAQAILKKD